MSDRLWRPRGGKRWAADSWSAPSMPPQVGQLADDRLAVTLAAHVAQPADLKVKIARRFRLVQHALDPDAPGAVRRPPVDGVALAVTQDGGADA